MKQSDQLKIFIVDDEIIYLNIFEQYLRTLGYDDITTFVDGDECINSLTERPDVIFLDYNMEPLSGYDILKKIKRFNPDTYVIMISGQNEIKPAIDTLKYGAFDYIEKGDAEIERLNQVLNRIQVINDSIDFNRQQMDQLAELADTKEEKMWADQIRKSFPKLAKRIRPEKKSDLGGITLTEKEKN